MSKKKAEARSEEKLAVRTAQASRLEGELDSLIKLNGFLDSMIKNVEWLLRQSTEEKRKLQEVIKHKKEEFRKSFGYMPKYQTDEAQPSDVEESE